MLNALRIILIAIGTVFGVITGFSFETSVHAHLDKIHQYHPQILFGVLFGCIGYLVGSTLAWELEILTERVLKVLNLKRLLLSMCGLVVGLFVANLFTLPLFFIFDNQVVVNFFQSSAFLHSLFSALIFIIPVSINLTLGILGMMIFNQRSGEMLEGTRWGKKEEEGLKILDTSVIIDGRIFDLCQARFIEGPIAIPQPVLNELRALSDSGDRTRRTRGKQGLTNLGYLKDLLGERLSFPEIEAVEGVDVDTSLVDFTMARHGALVTIDHNLNRVASVQGAHVLNINELSRALQTVAVPGETVEVDITKKGREPRQGVGYLSDGTMVVIEGGSGKVGQKKRVTISNVLQTSSGRMIFSTLQEG
ncbi:PIN/TRAM domain-containing protein [Thermodesulfobacteriota bacterium]